MLFLLMVTACETEKNPEKEIEVIFDKTKWREKDGRDYPYRYLMFNDVVYNDTIRSLNKDEILDLLGEPDKINDGHLYYLITQTHIGLWPLKTKTLVIKLAEDNSIEWIKIHG